MTRPVTALVAPILHHADAFLLRLTGGRLDITRASGLPVIELTTTGAKSGLPRTLPLAGYPDGDKFVLIASNFGKARHPAWYHNLKANPEAEVTFRGYNGMMQASELQGRQRKEMWERLVAYNPQYAEYQNGTQRLIPVLQLRRIPGA